MGNGNNNGHSAIDSILALNELQNMMKNGNNRSNQINPSTMQSVSNQYVNALPYGDLEKILYKGQTYGGRGVNIGREVPGYPTSSRRSGDYGALLQLLQQNPNYGDTLSSQGAKDFIKPEPSIMRQLLNALMKK